MALYLVVLVAGARAPSATPFLAAAGGAAGAASAGIAVQLAQRKVRVKAPLKVAAIAVTAVLLLFSAGGARYTYGAVGDVVVTLEFAPASVVSGSSASVTGNLTLFNVGATVVRVNPHFDLLVTDPQGGPVLRYFQGCIGRIVPPVESDLVELPPDGYLRSAFTLPIVWSADDSVSAPCGAAFLGAAGNYGLVGHFASGPFNAPGLVPVWTGEVRSEAKTLQVR